MEVQQFGSVSEIDPAEWDRLAGGDILARHIWHSTVETGTSGQSGFLYLLARDNGKLIGAAACRVHSKNDSSSLDQSFYGKAFRVARATGFGATPAIVVGSRFGMSPPFLFASGLSRSQAEQTVEALTRQIVDRAEHSQATVIIRNAQPGAFAETLSRSNFVATPDVPTAYIDIRWNTFAEFRRDLKKVHPATEKAIRNQHNQAKRDGIVIERVSNPEMVTADLHEVLDTHYRKLNGVSLPFSDSFLSDTVRNLGGEAELTVVRDASGVLGVHLCVSRGGVSHAMLVGTSTERARTTSTYFLILNQVMARAIETGARRLYFGRLVYDVKMRRGCSIEQSTIWIRGRSKLQRAGLRRLVPIRSMKIARLISDLEPVSQSNAAVMGRR